MASSPHHHYGQERAADALPNQEHLEDLYRRVRDRLKRGKLDNFKKTDLREIDDLVGAKNPLSTFERDSLQYDFFKLQYHLFASGKPPLDSALNSNPLSLKAISISLEFRDYLEELSADNKDLLVKLASQFLEEFRSDTLKLSTRNDRELVKEKARLLSVHANQLRRAHKYEEAINAVKSATFVLKKLLQPTGTHCHTVLGGLSYVESKLLRHHGQYKECEDKLTDAINYYSLWVMDNAKDPQNIQLASYKIALFLGNIAWCKNSRGFCKDALALINAARLLMLPTEWQLDKAHLELIYADVVRAFMGTDAEQLVKAISIVDRSYLTFKEHPHHRMQSRAAFASALLNFYANKLEAAEGKLTKVKEFSTATGDTKWLVNCSTLLARIRIKQGKAADALSFVRKSINEAETAKLKNQLVVAHIVKGEAWCLLENYEEATESFDEARKLNERRIGEGIEVSSERNKGWILLSIAHMHLLKSDVRQAKLYLERWEQLDGVELKWLQEKAEQLRQDVEALSSKDFTIVSLTDSLKWRDREYDLASWLINQAKLKTGSEDDNVIAEELGISTRRLGQLKSKIKERISTPETDSP